MTSDDKKILLAVLVTVVVMTLQWTTYMWLRS